MTSQEFSVWTKTAAPLSSLTAKCIKQCCLEQLPDSTQSLPIHMRQGMLDYLVRERVPVGSKFVCDLLQGGGVYSFDLWSLADNNLYKPQEVIAILETLAANCSSMSELIIGGSTWIYNQRIIRGPLKQLFSQSLPKLRVLKIQQISSAEEFLAICESCSNLVRLDICQPSLSDRDVVRVEPSLLDSKCDSIRRNLKELRLPSTVKNGGIVRLLAAFSNVKWLKVARFESVLDAIDEAPQYEGCNYYNQIKLAEKTLKSLRGLTISHPLGCGAVELVVSTCPVIEELSLEVQSYMSLSPIKSLTELKRLELRNSASTPLSYIEQVVPLLQDIGANLETLSLEQFDVLDLAQCARLCPNLNALSAQWFTIIGCNRTSATTFGLTRASREAMRKPFQGLRYLRLRPRAQREVSAEAVDYLLTHARHLEHCELYCCTELNDDHMNSILKTNGFRNLKQLILRHGHNVSKQMLTQLTTMFDTLQYVDCGRNLLSKAELVPNGDEEVNLLNVL